MGVRLRVLVVDDNRDTADSLASIVELCGHEVRAAYDGSAVVEIARKFAPHVVLLDIGLPNLNGFDLAKILREQEALRGVLLIAVTGYGDDAQRKKATQAGFNFLLEKPVDPVVLTEFLTMPEAAEGAGTNTPAGLSRPCP